MKGLLGLHARDDFAAARNWVALFGGADTREAMTAAMRWNLFVETVIGLGKAFGKARR